MAQEVRNIVFARTDQSFVRELNKAFFQHLHDLDMAFHKQRSIGAINQAINRGTRWVRIEEGVDLRVCL